MSGESVMDHFESPRNVGVLSHPDAAAVVANPACGDEVRIGFRLQGDRLEDAKFLAYGCHATIAVMSVVTERLRGSLVTRACSLTTEEIVSWFDRFPPGKKHAADLAVAALRRALATRALATRALATRALETRALETRGRAGEDA